MLQAAGPSAGIYIRPDSRHHDPGALPQGLWYIITPAYFWTARKRSKAMYMWPYEQAAIRFPRPPRAILLGLRCPTTLARQRHLGSELGGIE